ncbi:MAG: hypothetical protein HY807_08360 [Nitrospirae bacterium]|nr:hypothetical protein [Nitrospirota bacterium]
MYKKVFLALIFCFSLALFVSSAYAIGCDDPYQLIDEMSGDINSWVNSRTVRSRLNGQLDNCEKKIPGALQGDIRSENYAIRYVEQLKMYIQKYVKTNDINGEDGADLLQQADDLIDAITCVDCDKDLTVFVSSDSYSGDLNGITGADRTCQELADDAGLSGTYKAWLSTSRGYSPADSWDHSDQNYVLTDETIIAYDWYDLADGELNTSIWLNQYANGQSDDYVWTGTEYDGYPAGSFGDASEFCDDWTSDNNEANIGYSSAYYEDWTDYDWEYCDNYYHIYCFEQVDPRWDARCNNPE